MPNEFWKIEESIGAGLFFTWEGIHETRESAEAVIKRADISRARAARYRAGDWGGGPVRVE